MEVRSVFSCVSSLTVVTMKLFRVTRKFLTALGIDSSQAEQKCLLNFKNVSLLIGNSVLCSTNILFSYQEVDDFQVYMNIMYSAFTGLITQTEYLLHIWKMDKIFKFIENFETLIQTSKHFQALIGLIWIE